MPLIFMNGREYILYHFRLRRKSNSPCFNIKLYTNNVLFKMKKVQNPYCPYCNTEFQTVCHLFVTHSLYPGRKVATSLANITGITTRTRKSVTYHGFFSTRIKEHTESDKNSHIFKHFNTSPLCKNKYSPSCFSILDSASNSIDLKLKEAFYINKIKPELNKQLQH